MGSEIMDYEKETIAWLEFMKSKLYEEIEEINKVIKKKKEEQE